VSVFDLRQYRTEFYDTHFQRAKAIVEVLERLGRTHAAGELTFGSPISDFLPGAAKPAIHAQRTGAVGPRSREPVIVKLRDSIAKLPPMLKQTNRARNRAVRAVDALLAQFARVHSYAEQSIGLAQAALDTASSDSTMRKTS
jgi:hypothetical protein